jgi:carbonic anhydrase/acetyltransferase-like protein (isoleucine patch superfamily)
MTTVAGQTSLRAPAPAEGAVVPPVVSAGAVVAAGAVVSAGAVVAAVAVVPTGAAVSDVLVSLPHAARAKAPASEAAINERVRRRCICSPFVV